MDDRIQQIRVRGDGPGLDATIEEIRAAGICGCGRPHPHGGRCAWKREHGNRRNGSDGGGSAGRAGVTKRVKTPRAPRLADSGPSAEAKKPEKATSGPSCYFSVVIGNDGTELKIEGSSLAELRMLLELIDK